MSLRNGTARLHSQAVAHLAPPVTSTLPRAISYTTRRTLFGRLFGRNSRDANPQGAAHNPILEEFSKRKPQKRQAPDQGSLAAGNIFDEAAGPEGVPAQPARPSARAPQPRSKIAMDAVLNPDPDNRMQWERKKVIQQVKKRGRLTKTQLIKRTERESLNKSHFMKTSIKKLGMLARQIQGKSIDEAITQMRFSKKLIAQEVLKQLEVARDTAIVERGMGLGKVEGTAGEPVTVQLKNGKRHNITDRTGIYIDQAWVGRGPYEKELEYRARGQGNILRKPYTSISVVLKEEATRVRLHNERAEKQARRKVWIPLPDRPVSQQHQYPLW